MIFIGLAFVLWHMVKPQHFDNVRFYLTEKVSVIHVSVSHSIDAVNMIQIVIVYKQATEACVYVQSLSWCLNILQCKGQN